MQRLENRDVFDLDKDYKDKYGYSVSRDFTKEDLISAYCFTATLMKYNHEITNHNHVVGYIPSNKLSLGGGNGCIAWWFKNPRGKWEIYESERREASNRMEFDSCYEAVMYLFNDIYCDNDKLDEIRNFYNRLIKKEFTGEELMEYRDVMFVNFDGMTYQEHVSWEKKSKQNKLKLKAKIIKNK